jgi:LysM repeat protein
MSVLRRWWAILALLCVARIGEAKVLIHVARANDTPETLAAEYYGNRALALFVLEANGIGNAQNPSARSLKFRPGQKVRIPTAFRYRLKKGETLEKIAARFLDDKRRAPFLAQWSGLRDPEKVHEGTDVLVPFQFVHRAEAPESMAAVAKSFYGDASQSKLLLGYNFRSSPVLGPGERVVVPITHVRVRAVYAAPVAQPRAPEQKAAPAPQPEDTEKREAELAQRVSARLTQAENAYREGNYDDVPAALTKLLSEEDPSEKQLVAIHRLLAFAYVALGADEVAVKEFREVLERDPDATLDAAMVSPKIRGAFERAKKSP